MDSGAWWATAHKVTKSWTRRATNTHAIQVSGTTDIHTVVQLSLLSISQIFHLPKLQL